MTKIHFHPNYKHLKKDLEKIIGQFGNKGETVFANDRNTIKKINLNGIDINLKKFKIPNAFNAFIYTYIRKSKAKRSFENAEYLLKNHILTPHPIAFLENHTLFGLKESYYISLHVDYDFDFRELIHNPKYPDRKNILQQFTEFTFNLHEKHVNFLDHSPGNTLIVKDGKNYRFYLIDLNRMRFENLDYNHRIKNFNRLWLSKTMIKIIAATYADLSKKPYSETLDLLMVSSKKFQDKKNKKKLRKRSKRTFNKT